MSKQVTLAAEARAEDGKGAAGRLRRTGQVPAVIYGRGVEPTKVSVNSRELFHALHTSAGLNALIRLGVDGDEHLTMAREIQRDAVRGDILHVDFYAVDRNRPIEVDIPLNVIGQEDIVPGGVLSVITHSLTIKVKPLEVPDSFEIDVTGMEIGDTKRVSDIAIPEGVELVTDPEEVATTVTLPTVEEEVEEAAADTAEGEEAAEGDEAAPLSADAPDEAGAE